MSKAGKRLIAAIREAAEHNPGTVDQNAGEGGCLYVRHGAPSCIVGHGLWKTGLIDASFADLPAHPDDPGTTPNSELFTQIIDHLDVDLDEDEIEWIALVQQFQDGGLPWREAIDMADRRR